MLKTKKLDEFGGQTGNDEQTEEVVVTEEKIVGDDGVERTIIKKTTTRRLVQTQNITQGARQTTVKRSVISSDGKILDEEFQKFSIEGDSKIPIEARKSRSGSSSSSSSDDGFAQKIKSFLSGKPKEKSKDKKQQSIKDNPENTTEQFVDNRQSSHPSEDEKEFAEECLKWHNHYRAKHGVSPLKLSQKLNDYAKEWVQQIAKRDTLEHRPHSTYGENIFMKWSSDPKFKISGRDPVDNWYEEIKVHQFGREPTSLASGHFTQVVWKGSQEMGVAKAKSPTGKIIVVANYSPAGNIIGQFTENVQKPKD